MHTKIKWLKNLAGAVMLGLVSANAFGATINLTCKFVSGNADGGNIRGILDDSANTAIFDDDPVSPANFTETTVTWGKVESRDSYWQYNKFYNFNRNTGALVLSGTEKSENDPQWIVLKGIYHCTAAQK
jgi:hypothetical protein